MLQFSIVIPLYNKEKYIANTLKSVLSQDYGDFEVIIVDDASTDGSIAVVKQFDDTRIRLFSIPNSGTSAARNYGILQAKYDWIAFLDADDLWMKYHLSEMVLMIERFPRNKIFTTITWHKTFKESFDESVNQDIQYSEGDYFEYWCKHNPYIFSTDTIVINKICFASVGLFDVRYRSGNDLDMWERLARGYKFIFSTKVTAKYIAVEDSITSSKSKKPFSKTSLSKTSVWKTSSFEHIYFLQRRKGYIFVYAKRKDAWNLFLVLLSFLK
jgi:glycosyltransferase involved in cell wall biosynthesis